MQLLSMSISIDFGSVSIDFGAIRSWNARNRQKNPQNPYFGVQCHPRSLNLAPIESQCTTSY